MKPSSHAVSEPRPVRIETTVVMNETYLPGADGQTPGQLVDQHIRDFNRDGNTVKEVKVVLDA